jgi:hypothetical protein
MKTIALVAAIALSSAFAQAKPKHEGPCQKIRKSCEAAGFAKGAHKTNGKGLFVDCMKKIMNGETVAGVTVDAQDVSKCKEVKAKRHARKAAHK